MGEVADLLHATELARCLMWKPLTCNHVAGLQAAIEQDLKVYYILSNGLALDIISPLQLRLFYERHKQLCLYSRDRWSKKEWEYRAKLPNPYLQLVREALRLQLLSGGWSDKRLFGYFTTADGVQSKS